MLVVTHRRSLAITGVVAFMVFLPSVRNGWAGDDLPIIADNPTVHTLGGASNNFFKTYWPVEDGESAGQYRPLAVASYAVDWALSEGNPTWFHFVNVLWHVAASVVLVAVLSRWLSPISALVTGALFAIHPVHVEAVANVVGRAELMVAVCMGATVLAARRYRATHGRRRGVWLAATLLGCLLGLLSKEHGVVVIGLLLVDDFLDSSSRMSASVNLYIGVMFVTFGWLYVFEVVAGQWVTNAQAATIRGLSTAERLWTMLPAQLDVVRLLVWPFDLAADYNPLVIPRRTSLTALAVLGACTVGAVLTLGVAAGRRSPALALAMAIGVFSYAPTSNLAFASGIMLAERNLYLAALVPAVAIGYLVTHLHLRARMWGGLAVSLLIVSWSGRAITRIPVWLDSETLVIEDFAQHSENYRARMRLGAMLGTGSNDFRALAEGTAAGAIFPEDPFVAVSTVPRALETGQASIGLQEARRATRLVPDHPVLAALEVDALLASGDSLGALTVASRITRLRPTSITAAGLYRSMVRQTQQPQWQTALADARYHWLSGHFVQASSALRNLGPAGTGPPSQLCGEVQLARQALVGLEWAVPAGWNPQLTACLEN